MQTETDTIVIGASAAGLAAAACLMERGVAVEVLEASDCVGVAWRHHYDRLHLHTPKSASTLPGLPMPSAWPRYPSRDNVVQYLEKYAQVHDIRPHFGQQVTRVEQADGAWVVTTSERTWRAQHVVIATGATRIPVRPTWPGMEQYTGDVLHSSEYRNGEPWRGTPVVVVGFGNSACEQAIDLVEHGAHPTLSVRSEVNVVKRDVLGVVPVLQLGILMRHLPPSVADAIGAPLVRLTVGDITALGLRKLPYGPNTQIARDRHIPLLDIDHFTPTGVVFTDGTEQEAALVLLGTGYRPGIEDFLPQWQRVCDADGRPLVSGGTTALPGLFFCGMFVAPSGMLREAGREAQRIARLIRP